MTREEAIKVLNNFPIDFRNSGGFEAMEALKIAILALRPVSREQLSEYKTCELVEELRKREGVETHIAEPYQDVAVSVNGPAVVLVVID